MFISNRRLVNGLLKVNWGSWCLPSFHDPRRTPCHWSEFTPKLDISDSDVRHEPHLRMQGSVFHPKFLPFASSLETQIAWEGVRGWFDERVKVGRR